MKRMAFIQSLSFPKKKIGFDSERKVKFNEASQSSQMTYQIDIRHDYGLEIRFFFLFLFLFVCIALIISNINWISYECVS